MTYVSSWIVITICDPTKFLKISNLMFNTNLKLTMKDSDSGELVKSYRGPCLRVWKKFPLHRHTESNYRQRNKTKTFCETL